MTCPPCSHTCNEGRDCPASSGATRTACDPLDMRQDEEGHMLTSRAFWAFGAISVLAWIGLLVMVWPQQVRAFLAFFCWPL